MSDVPYFYSSNPYGYISNTLPAQAIKESQKNSNWKEACMDALEIIGLNQLTENLKFQDFYDMKSGRLVYTDLVDLPPQLREIGDLMSDFELPTYLSHFDLLGRIVNGIVSLYSKNADKFHADSNDDFLKNEFKRRQTDLMNSWVKQQLDKEIEIRLVEEGLDPERSNFQSEEEKQAYIEAVRQRTSEMTPPEIQSYMSEQYKYENNFLRWANLTLEQDQERHRIDRLDKQNLEDFLLTGRCFRHYRMGWDFYKPERWSPINTFFSQDLDTKYIEEGEYVGRVHFYTPSQVINNYGSQLSEKQQKQILNGNSSSITGKPGTNPSFKTLFERNLHNTVIAPHENYNDYNFMLQLQDQTATPLGETTITGKNGEQVTVPKYLPQRNGSGSYSPNLRLAQKMRGDLNLRTDLIQVTEAYWQGYKRIAQLTFRIPDTGRIEVATVTEDILEDFLRDNEIKKITTISIEEHEKKSLEDRVNTIVYTYLPTVYEGVKISAFNKDYTDDIYLKCTPTDVQLKGNSNIYDNKLPVAGIIDDSLGNILRPFQVGYNFAMNSIQNLSEKEIGVLYMFDMSMLPAEYKNFGDSVDEVLNNLVNVARRTNMMPFDSNRQNTQAASGNIPMQAMNLSLTSQIQSCYERALFYEQAAYKQVGITEQMLGAPTTYQTAEGVQSSQEASYAQLERYYDIFAEFKKSTCEMNLNFAQYAKKHNKDITVFYTNSDQTTALLEFTDDNFYLRELHILPTTNAKKRREINMFKQYILNTNTLADDTLALANFIFADTTQEALAIARDSITRRQAQAQEEHNMQMQQLQTQSQLTDELNQRSWNREEQSKDKDRLVKLQVAEISKDGKETNTNYQKDLFNQINQANTLNLKQQNAEMQGAIQQQDVNRKRLKDESEADYRERMIALKERDQDLREKQIEGKRFGDVINKN